MYIVKSRIKSIRHPRFILLLLIFSVLIFDVRAEKMPHNRNGRVNILILSKHLRQLKEHKINDFKLSFPKYGEIDTGEKRIPCRTLSILYTGNSFTAKTEQNTFGKGIFTLYPQNIGDTFSIEINGEKRQYPLPLNINNSGNDIELSIEETVNQFAIDSAWGELGDLPEKYSEALYALAHLIKARCALTYLTNKHAGHDFCDLTCCQTYRGRSGKTFNDTVSIKTDGITKGLFFHTSGGGTLFTESIFNDRGRNTTPPKDLIYSENLTLSREKYPKWEASINGHELSEILYPEKKTVIQNIIFDRDKEIVFIESDHEKENVSPETFRIKINRVKGWNFLKSNNYYITHNNGDYEFTGSGLGHCTGMSFEGALQLAEKGYSRYEILDHYYPGLEYNTSSAGANYLLQYIVFDTESGKIMESSSGSSFKNRTIPCGSLFKLFIALYLSEKRKDLFYNYSYTCTDMEIDRIMPEHCWIKTGHGKLDINGALCHSCNKYFASLYRRIEQEDFTIWIRDFTLTHGITLSMPEIKNKNEFSNLMGGLNFRVTITIDGIIKLNRYLYNTNKNEPSTETEIIFNALHKTFTDGTAKKILNQNKNLLSATLESRKNLWGKTGTVIAGTNTHYGYGLFTGGLNSTGIVSILKKGTGAMAAHESELILLKNDRITTHGLP